MRLEKKIRDRSDCEILLVDRNDCHQYIHRLHEVAGGTKDEEAAFVPVRKLIEGKKIRFIQANVLRIDPARKLAETDKGTLKCDEMVVALGSGTGFFGIKGLREHALTLRSLEDARRIRKKIEEIFAATEGSGKELTFIIGGGGFTGTELAGQFAEWFPILARKHGLDPSKVRVVIVEMQKTLLPGWHPELASRAMEILRSKGVELVLGRAIVETNRKGVVLSDGSRLEASLIIWAGGIAAVDQILTICPVGGNRAPINEYSESANYRGVYVVGDSALVCNPKTGRPLPTSAHIATEEGSIVADNIYADLYGGVRKRYIPKHIGEVVSLGGRDAVGELWGATLTGIMAALAKKLIHLAYVHSIGGFRLLLRRA